MTVCLTRQREGAASRASCQLRASSKREFLISPITRAHSIPKPAVPKIASPFFEAHSIEPLLVKIVHIFAIALAISHDLEVQVRLIAHRPANEFINFRAAERGLFHRIGDAGISRIAANYRAGNGFMFCICRCDFLELNRR